jgi:hypothetical protein
MNASKQGASFARECLVVELLPWLAQATLHELTLIKRFSSRKHPAGSAEMRSAECGVRKVEREERAADAGCSILDAGPKGGQREGRSGTGAEGRYVFRWTGRDWMVVVDGLGPFFLDDTLATRYVHYWLHHPNQPIGAFDLEVLIRPEKGEARGRNSIQAGSDAQARHQYRPELERLRKRQEEAQSAGAREEVERLEEEIQMYERLLDERCGAADTGRRASDNVRQVVRALRAHLRRGGPAERRFEEHLRRHLSLGLECVYNSPNGKVWQ